MRWVRTGMLVLGLIAGWKSTESLAQPLDPSCQSERTVSGLVASSGTLLNFQLETGKQFYYAEGLQISQASLSNAQIAGKQVILVMQKNATPDRYRRLPAQILLMSNGRNAWLQARLLADGKSVLSGQYENSLCMTSLSEIENTARRSLAGDWKSLRTPMHVTDLKSLRNRMGEFGIVEGKVRSIGDRARRLYLNFGQNWSQDFTIIVAKTGRNAFKGNWDRLRHLADKKIRIRGMLEMNAGPLIRLVYEGQLEIGD